MNGAAGMKGRMMSDAYSPEVEQQVLGLLLTDNALFSSCDVRGDWFHDGGHRWIFERIAARVGDGSIASPVSLSAEADASGMLDALGGRKYLARLMGGADAAPNYRHYVDALRDAWARRTAIEIISAASDRLASMSLDDKPQVVLTRLESDLSEVAATASPKPLVRSWLSTSVEAINGVVSAYNADGVFGTPTGFADLDAQIGGFGAGDMIVLAGRPSMGKTAIALGIAWQIARRGQHVLFASLEMPAAQLFPRFASAILAERGVDIPYFNIRTGRLNQDELRAVVETAKEFEHLPMTVAERDCRSMPRLRAAAHRAKAAADRAGQAFGLVVIDYLQLIESPDSRMNDYARVSYASGQVKSLAMDLGVPVLALSQLNRSVEARPQPVPRLSDLRESGRLEEDADTIMLAFRQEYYLTKAIKEAGGDLDTIREATAALENARNRLTLLIPKARGGPTGAVELYFRPEVNELDGAARLGRSFDDHNQEDMGF